MLQGEFEQRKADLTADGRLAIIPMRRGFLYLVAIIDWATRRVLAWRLSNSLNAEFCVEALNEALA
jgi:putative transposase